jgi:hypothetical protein
VPVGGENAREEVGFFHRDSVAKKGGASVSTTLFMSADSEPISGLLYTEIGIWNAPEQTGRDIVFVQNPVATVVLPAGTFEFVRAEFVPDPANPKGAIIRREGHSIGPR